MRGERCARRLVDMPKLRVAVGMILPLPRLLIRVQPKPEPPQQLPGRPIRNLMPGLHQRPRDLSQALRAPPQRRLRIPTRIRIHQPLEIPKQRRIRHRQRRTPRTPTPDLPRLQPHPRRQLLKPAPNRVLADPRRTRHRSDPPIPQRPRLTRHPQPPLTLVQLRTHPRKPLRNLRFIDHAAAIRRPPPTSYPAALNHSQVLSALGEPPREDRPLLRPARRGILLQKHGVGAGNRSSCEARSQAQSRWSVAGEDQVKTSRLGRSISR